MKSNELLNILQEDKPSIKIKEREDEVFKLIPELEKTKGFNQNNLWHIYDVYEHTLHVVDYVPNDIDLRIAALFHDIGKPLVYTEDENGVGHFPKHYVESLNIFLNFAKDHLGNGENISNISRLIYYHDLRFKNNDKVILNKLVDLFTYPELEQLYELKKADLLAQNEMYHYLLKDLEEQKDIVLKRSRSIK